MRAPVEAMATNRGLALRGPGGIVFLSNRQLAAVAEFAIALQDLLQLEADIEPNGDELDGNGSEEDFMHHGLDSLSEPGCPIADPGGCEFAV